ncbi:MAG: sulfur carrier protein ThiS [Patulibacter sp.]|nr:sulfur carrier protein ThiS [Patulibacter sp.]
MSDLTETLIVNGEPRQVVGRTVVDLLTEMQTAADARGVAVAIDGEVVVRSEWPRRILRAGERVEVLTAIQGG